MGNVGATELIIIVLLILVFFGSKKIPELAQGLGKGIREFRKATKEIQEEADAEPVAEIRGPREQMTTCIYCNSRVAVGARFCPTCGKSLEPPRCPKCGKVSPLGSKFCVECGEKLS
ncbi:MAG TPA: twin-arginine translocase TatA/TatE family subunit [Bacteroidota bacterium]|nr:twin-arginine translocase TatA/TatE family subunit [Bacteroidota bacterium]